MKKNIIKAIKTLLLSLVSLSVGFAAIAFPFQLFSNLSAEGMRYLFIGELTLYFIIGIAFLLIKGARDERAAKEEARKYQRRIKFEQAKRDYYDFAA